MARLTFYESLYEACSNGLNIAWLQRETGLKMEEINARMRDQSFSREEIAAVSKVLKEWYDCNSTQPVAGK